MDAEIAKKGELTFKLVGGDLYLTVESAGADLTLKVKSDYFVDKLEEVIPGDQTQLAGMIKAALKG